MAGAVRKHTDLSARCKNVTRWSSTVEIFERLLKLAPYVHKLNEAGTEKYIPTYHEETYIENLSRDMKDSDSETPATH